MSSILLLLVLDDPTSGHLPPPGTFHMITETSDRMIVETGGDHMITE